MRSKLALRLKDGFELVIFLAHYQKGTTMPDILFHPLEKLRVSQPRGKTLHLPEMMVDVSRLLALALHSGFLLRMRPMPFHWVLASISGQR